MKNNVHNYIAKTAIDYANRKCSISACVRTACLSR